MMLEAPKIQKTFFSRVEKIVGSHGFSVRAVDRFNYSRDSNFKSTIRRHYGQFEAAPDLVAWPRTAAQVQELVRLAARHRVPLVPHGGGSGVCGGALPVKGGMVVDVKRMNRILKVDAENRTVTSDAGIFGRNLEEGLNRRGFTLGHFPSSIGCATLGGYLAARSAGQASSLYGKIEDLVQGLEVVTGTGDLIRTRGVRNRAGIDLNHVFLGSEGILGLFTQATLKIHPLPEKKLFRGIRFRDLKTGMEAMRRIMQSGLRPSVLRLYDELDSWLFLSAKGDSRGKRITDFFIPLARNLKYRSLKTLLRLPQTVNAATKFIPGGCLLILQHEGSARLIAEELRVCLKIAKGLDGTDLGEGPGLYWEKHRYSVAYNASPLFYSGSFTDTIEIAAPWEHLLPTYRAVTRALSKHALVMAHLSHVYPEGGSFYFTFVAPLSGLKKSEELYDRIWNEALKACQENEAVISHHHGVGRLKAKFMDEEWGDGLRLLKAFKDAYDPSRILNPGALFIEEKKSKRRAA